MSALLPCPFCGGEAQPSGLTTGHTTVLCTVCRCEGSRKAASKIPAEAIAAWNQRAGMLDIETMPMWAVGVVTDGVSAAVSQKAESDFDGHYFAVDPEDALEWEPTHWMPLSPTETGEKM